MFFTRRLLLLFGLFVIAVNQVLAGYCNAESSNCGQQCDTHADCLDGNCWEDKDACPEPTGYCNAESGGSPESTSSIGKCNHLSGYKCGQPCNLDADCYTGSCWKDIARGECDAILIFYCDAQSGSKCGQQCNEDDSECSSGHCVKYEAQCGDSDGFCDFQSTNCGNSCREDSNCSGGHCLKDKPACHSNITVGTYIGAEPGGVTAPSLESIPTELNLIMLSFAKDADHDGNFKAFSGWEPQHLTKTAIEQDKGRNPNRRFLVSVGGTVGYGGTFEIKPGMSTNDWVSNSVRSIVNIITSLSADGVEIQFEGNTDDSQFKDAITGVLEGLHQKGYLTAIGPYKNYGQDSTWYDYKQLPMKYVDFINMQLYGMQDNTVEGVQYFVEAVLQYLGSDSSKLVAGFNSYQSLPQPDVAFKVVNLLRGPLRGAFTWTIENSRQNIPPYCLEKGLAMLLKKEVVDLPKCEWS